MMGIYLQKSWIILNTFAFLLNLPLYVSATPLLSLLGQSPAEISKAARRFSLWDDPSALCLRRQLRQPQVLAGNDSYLKIQLCLAQILFSYN